MSPCVRALACLALLLLLALGWIAWREAGLRALVAAPEHRAALRAVEERNAAALAALKARHDAELGALRERLDAQVARAEGALREKAAALDAAARRARERARADAAGLRAETAQAAGVPVLEIHADREAVFLTRKAALAWLDRDLTLRREVALSEGECERRLALKERDLVPPLVKARQEAEWRAGDLDNQLRLALAERDYARRQAAAGKGETLTWSLTAGALGLVVGAVAGGVGAAYLLRR